MSSVTLDTLIGDIVLRNPLILAAGILGTSYSAIERVYQSGFGAMVSKSIGFEPNFGYNNPTIILLEEIQSAINAVGLANPGALEFHDKLIENKEKRLPIVYSIYGSEIEHIENIIQTLNDLNPLAYELNVSCPHGGKSGLQVCHDDSFFLEMVLTAKNKANCPIWVKLSPNTININNFADIAVRGGADALVAINTLKAMIIDIETMKPILANKLGGLSGKAVKPVGVHAIYDLYAEYGEKIPLIGVGGINNAFDVIEYILAGASAVQIGTAFAYTNDQDKFGHKILDDLSKFLLEKQINLKDIIGKAHT